MIPRWRPNRVWSLWAWALLAALWMIAVQLRLISAYLERKPELVRIELTNVTRVTRDGRPVLPALGGMGVKR